MALISKVNAIQILFACALQKSLLLFCYVSCLTALQEGDFDQFHGKLKESKQVLFVLLLSHSAGIWILFYLCLKYFRNSCGLFLMQVKRALNTSTHQLLNFRYLPCTSIRSFIPPVQINFSSMHWFDS